MKATLLLTGKPRHNLDQESVVQSKAAVKMQDTFPRSHPTVIHWRVNQCGGALHPITRSGSWRLGSPFYLRVSQGSNSRSRIAPG